MTSMAIRFPPAVPNLKLGENMSTKAIDITSLAKARLERINEYQQKLEQEKQALSQLLLLSQNPDFQRIQTRIITLIKEISELEAQERQIQQQIKNKKDELNSLQLQQTKLLSVIKKAINNSQ
jgi:chromosome segregation ATPase